MKLRILYEDPALLLCYKPAGFPVQTADVRQEDCVSELKNYLASGGAAQPYLGVVHRLDQPVEGLLVFARTRRAAQALSRQIESGACRKSYRAVTDGVPEPPREAEDDRRAWVRLEHYLRKDGKAGMSRLAQPQEAGAKPAILYYRVCGCSREAGISRIEVRLETGRLHQIRAQMAAAGFPLLGDGKYGTEASRQKSAALGVRYVALCAAELSLTHPISGRRLSFSCEPENPAFALC